MFAQQNVSTYIGIFYFYFHTRMVNEQRIGKFRYSGFLCNTYSPFPYSKWIASKHTVWIFHSALCRNKWIWINCTKTDAKKNRYIEIYAENTTWFASIVTIKQWWKYETIVKSKMNANKTRANRTAHACLVCTNVNRNESNIVYVFVLFFVFYFYQLASNLGTLKMDRIEEVPFRLWQSFFFLLYKNHGSHCIFAKL